MEKDANLDVRITTHISFNGEMSIHKLACCTKRAVNETQRHYFRYRHSRTGCVYARIYVSTTQHRNVYLSEEECIW